MTTCTESIRIDCSPQDAAAYLGDVHNLPEWTGFFRAVGRPVDDRFEMTTAMGITVRTRIERGDGGRYTISSLVGEREERAKLDVEPVVGGVEVSLTLVVHPALADHAADEAGAIPEDGVAAQRSRMCDELRRLRAAVTARAPAAPDADATSRRTG